MKTYWDYTEKERSALTEDQVKAMLDVELMTNGVLRPTPPVLQEIPANPLGARRVFYGIQTKSKYGSVDHLGICFESADAAFKFAELKPLIRDCDYEVGREYAFVKPVSDTTVMTEELYSVDQINEFRSTMKNRKAATESNAKLQSEFNTACAVSGKITDRVWADWYKQRDEATALQRVVDTYKEYLTLTGSDEQMALKFLGKAYTATRIQEARDWYEGSIPKNAFAEPMPSLASASLPSSPKAEPDNF